MPSISSSTLIAPDKDVDGFSAVNVGRLVQNRAVVSAGTPSGVMELLRRSSVPIAGRHAVVIGRSDIVGKPMALCCCTRTRRSPSATPGLPMFRRRRAGPTSSSRRSAGRRS